MSDYRKTELYDSHQSLKAKLVPFSGFWMPLQYSSITKEHHHVRSKCGVFDVSHMGVYESSKSSTNIHCSLEAIIRIMTLAGLSYEGFLVII